MLASPTRGLDPAAVRVPGALASRDLRSRASVPTCRTPDPTVKSLTLETVLRPSPGFADE